MGYSLIYTKQVTPNRGGSWIFSRGGVNLQGWGIVGIDPIVQNNSENCMKSRKLWSVEEGWGGGGWGEAIPFGSCFSSPTLQ